VTPRLRRCGNPDCRICRWRDEEHPDSGHPVDESVASLLLGTAAVVLWFVLMLLVLPVLAA
jgi:hypothetical protein